jgi:hypothetical protein
MWQRGGRASRDGQDGEIILLVDEWVEGSRTAPPSIQKGRQINGQSSQDSQLLDEATSAEKQNKMRKLTLSERRGKLPNFWYMLANDPGCLRARFLDHFDEPQEFRIHIRKDRCCSHCNPDLQLGKLDNHYLYCERGNSLSARRKKVLGLVTTWAEDQVSAAFPNPSFQLTVHCFISADQLTQLAKDAHVIMNLDDLRKALGSWRFFQNYGVELLANLRAAHHATEEAVPRASRKAKAPGQNSQGGDIWTSIATPASMNQPAPLLTMPASKQPVAPTCRPLGMVSGNAPAQVTEAPDPAPPREPPKSSFGRVRKASRRLVE